LHLSERCAWNRVDALEAARHFERRELLATCGLELRRVEVADEIRDRHFTAHGIIHAHEQLAVFDTR
jgi:hypothetical protein